MSQAGFCPHCGTPHPAGSTFCANCGLRLDAPAAAPPPPPPAPPPAAPPPLPPPVPPAYPPQAYAQPGYPQPPAYAPPPGYAPPPAAYPPTYAPPAPPVPVPPAVRAPGRGRTVAGGVIMLLGATMPWIHIEGAGDTSSFKIPFEFLFNANANNLDQGGFTVGLVLVALALGAMFSAVAKGSPRIRKVLGRGAMLIAIVYGGQLFQVLDSLGASSEAFKVLGVGVYVTFVGGVLTSWGKK